MKLKTITCPTCSKERDVRYSQSRYIARGISSGNCNPCAQKLNPPVLVRMAKGYKHSEETKKKIGAANSIVLKGRAIPHLRTAEVRNKISKALTGKKLSAEHIVKSANSNRGRITSIETRRKLSEALKGSKGYWYRGGVTPINNLVRKSLDYKLWREAVFKRDNWTCQNSECGIRGGKLQADHIKPFALFPELRFAIDNGQTLCQPCHAKTPTYGYRTTLMLRALMKK